MLEKSLEKICAEAFLENLQAKDIFSKFAENTPELRLPITTFSEVIVAHYRPWTSQNKYIQNVIWIQKELS